MANELVVDKTYADTEVLDASDLDASNDSIEAYFNNHGVGNDQIQQEGINASNVLFADGVTTVQSPGLGIIPGSIGNNQMGDGAVTHEKLVSNISHQKLSGYSTIPTLGLNTIALAGPFTGSVSQAAGSVATVTIGSVSLSTTGRGIKVVLLGNGGSTSYVGLMKYGGLLGSSDIYATQSTLTITASSGLGSRSTVYHPRIRPKANGLTGTNFITLPQAIFHAYPPGYTTSVPADTYTISLTATGYGDEVLSWQNIRLVAYEI